jgi:ATP-dependent DNA ligase
MSLQTGPITGWLPTDATAEEFEVFITDPRWLLQRKADGKHVIATRTEDGVIVTNKKGVATAHKPNIAKALTSVLRPGMVICGELLAQVEHLVLFDMPVGTTDLRSRGYLTRWTTARRLIDLRPWSALLSFVETAGTVTTKRALLERLHRENAEGAIAKLAAAPYTPGRPAHGGTLRRLVFDKRADVVIRRREGDTTRSFDLFLVNAAHEVVAVGAANACSFYDKLTPGDAAVAEVEYRYCSPTHQMIHAQVKSLRDDKTLEDCRLDQLVVADKFAGRVPGRWRRRA